MPAGTEYLGHIFDVESITGKKFSIDTSLNVIKRREVLSYHSGVPLSSANIAYVGADPVEMVNSLSIADRSTSLVANRPTTAATTTISGVKNFTIATERFLVTDVFTTALNTFQSVPLFLKHILDETRVGRVGSGDLTLDTDVKLISVEILDLFLEPIEVSELKVDYVQGIIYSNLVSEFISSGDFTPYYVKYTVRDNDIIYTYIDLLDNQSVYTLAEFSDLTALLEIIPDGRKVYLIEETIDGFLVTLPVVGSYAYKASDNARIEIVEPTGSQSDDPWHVKITNGNFITNVQGSPYRYRIAEFLSQTFSPYPPLKSVPLETSTILTKTLIKLDNTNIVESDIDLLYVTVLINDSSGDGVAAFTTDPSLDGLIADNDQPYKFWNRIDRYGIKSIDHLTGLVDIDGLELTSDYEVLSLYTFEENFYEFTLLDFNPISNRRAINTRVSLFIDPETLLSSKTQTLYYLTSDESGRVVESNWPDFDNDAETYDGQELYYELKPDWKLAGPHHLFIDELSTESSGLFLVLGDVTVDEGQDIDGVTTLDTRIRGGGLAEDKKEEAFLIQPEAQWYADEARWDGLPYPKNANYFIEVPATILDGTGGIFKTNEVKEVIQRHTAGGVYPISRAYGISIDITSIQMGDDIVLSWLGKGIDLEARGIDIVYNVYYSVNPDGAWTLSNTIPISHSDSGMSHTVTGLQLGSVYYISIVGGIIRDSEFVPIMTQYVKPGSSSAAGIGEAPMNPVKIRKFIPKIASNTNLSHQFEYI